MIYTEEQLYQVIRDAKEAGWGPTLQFERGVAITGPPMLLLVDMQWVIRKLDGVPAPHLFLCHKDTEREAAVPVAPWLVDSILRREIAKSPCIPPDETDAMNEEFFRLVLSGHCSVTQVVWSSSKAKQEFRAFVATQRGQQP